MKHTPKLSTLTLLVLSLCSFVLVLLVRDLQRAQADLRADVEKEHQGIRDSLKILAAMAATNWVTKQEEGCEVDRAVRLGRLEGVGR